MISPPPLIHLYLNLRNLDVYVTCLRACLKNDPGVEIITLKGVGCQMVY